MQNAENLSYNRYSKYLLEDINRVLLEYDQNSDADYYATLAELGIDTAGQNGFTDEHIASAPDIQTIPIIQGLLKKFHEIINKKTLGEELLAVRNAGRYSSGATVLADIGPVSMTLTDEVASNILKTANDALENSIDAELTTGGYARKIPIYDSVTSRFGYGQELEYTNYFFGTKARDIMHPELCTIARGSNSNINQFGRDILVEANAAFDVDTVEAHVEKLTTDTELFARYQMQCFDENGAKIQSYWGGNSLLRVVTDGTGTVVEDPLNTFPEPPTFHGFSEPIFSLGGMKESNRLPVASVAHCTTPQFQYTLKNPHLYLDLEPGADGSDTAVERAYPNEWNRIRPLTRDPRFTCFSEIIQTFEGEGSRGPIEEYEGSLSGLILTGVEIHTSPIPIIPTDFFEEVIRYQTDSTGSIMDPNNCLVGTITVDGSIIAEKDNECTLQAGADGTLNNNTTYRSIVYHTIDSLSHHTSPTVEELAAAKKNGSTPSLAIDTKRYVEFITPKGNVARIEYPNFFQVE